MGHEVAYSQRCGYASAGNFRPQRYSALAILLMFWGCAPLVARERQAPALTAGQFAGLIERFSEDNGYFWNDNFVSNEASYLHPLKKIRELGIHGGVYLGVGPNQNLTYIAKVQPRYSFIVDIRRQNLLEHLLFKALFHFAADRREYLELLLSRPIQPKSLTSRDYTVEDLVRYFQTAIPDPLLYKQTQSRIRSYLLDTCHLKLSEQDWSAINKIHTAFLYRGLSIKYDYIPVPTYGEFLLERDLDGKHQDFLNSAKDFNYLKELQEENRIIPVVGDFAGNHALIEIGKYLRAQNEKVTVLYTSNVEQYLLRNMVWGQFIENAKQLPLDDRAVFIRAYWSNYVSHPEGVAGYKFTQILQWAKPFLESYNPNVAYSYWDIVTTQTIKLR